MPPTRFPAGIQVGTPTAIADLVDNSGGAADGTIADVPAAYNEATLANNTADLAAKINAILGVLRSAGLIT